MAIFIVCVSCTKVYHLYNVAKMQNIQNLA